MLVVLRALNRVAGVRCSLTEIRVAVDSQLRSDPCTLRLKFGDDGIERLFCFTRRNTAQRIVRSQLNDNRLCSVRNRPIQPGKGRRRRIAWTNTALADDAGRVRHVIGTGLDITEHKRAEAALAQAEAQLRAVITQTPLVLFAVDAAGLFTVSEGMGLKTLGLEPGQVSPPHSHAHREAFVVCLEGEVRFTPGEGPAEIKRNEMRFYDGATEISPRNVGEGRAAFLVTLVRKKHS